MAGRGNVEGCASCAKWCLIIFNILFCLIGIGLVATGIYAYVQLRDYLNIIGDPMINAPAIVLIVFGCITFIIAAIGCFGACKESACLLFTFAAIIGILLIAEIAAGIAAFVFRSKISDLISNNASKFMMQYDDTNQNNAATDFWDKVQKQFDCCGVNGYTDWENLSIAPQQGGRVPASCGNPNKGCFKSLIDFFDRNIYIVAAIGVAFGVIELMGIVLACCVACNIRKGETA